jgi:hypothetical protein
MQSNSITKKETSMLKRPIAPSKAAPISAVGLAFAVTLQALPASARCDSTFDLPMGFVPRKCQDLDNSGDLAEGVADDSSGDRGEEYSYQIELLSGSLATGLLLDDDGEIVRAQDGGHCPLVLDFFPNDGVDDSNFCDLRVANSAAAFQVVAE